MKKSRYIALSALLAYSGCMAAPVVTWLNTVHDFGAFDEDTKHKTAYFRFVNTGDEDVSVVSVNATCGCTVPKYTTDAVAPGDTATIEVVYDPTGRPGRFEKSIYVRTSETNERTRLRLKGSVIGNAETIRARYPVNIGDFKLRNGAAMMGRVYHGHNKIQYVDAYNQSDREIAPVVTGQPPYIRVTVVPEHIGPGEVATLNFEFLGDKCDQWGIITDSVSIAPSAGEAGVSFPVVAVVEEDFSQLTGAERARAPKLVCEADRIVLPAVAEGAEEMIRAKLKITNAGKEPLEIRRVYSGDKAVAASVGKTMLKKGESTCLTVTYDVSKQSEGIINSKLSIITNDPDNQSMMLRIVGERNAEKSE